MNNPKIKVEADPSSFDAELNKLKSQISQIGDALKTETGKAKVASKLENLGATQTNQASSYFRNYSGELTEDYHTTSSQNAIQRKREKFHAQQAQERHAQQTKRLLGLPRSMVLSIKGESNWITSVDNLKKQLGRSLVDCQV